MKNINKQRRLLASLLVALALLLTFALVFVWLNSTKDTSDSSSGGLNEVIWVDYESEKYGISFKYPENATVSETEDDQYSEIFIQGPEGEYQISLQPSEVNMSLGEYLSNLDQDFVEDVEFDGDVSTAVTKITGDAAGGGTINIYWFEKNGKLVRIFTTDERAFDSREFIESFEFN